MIVLITGLPGNGKTLYALDWVKRKAEKEARPVFYARIKGLTLPWTVIDPFAWMSCPPNAIVVIDEVQQSNDPVDPKSPSLFGVRQRGAAVPAWAAALETHRHMGIDLVLITQDPMLLDVHDRKLVGLHFHVKRNFGLQRATVHEFGGCRPNVAQSTSGSVRHEWSYPKEVYGWYKSAEVHTMKARVPMRVWVLLGIPFVIAGLSWFAWSRYLTPDRELPTLKAAAGSSESGTASSGLGQGAGSRKSVAQYVEQFQPRVAGLAYTAPVYDDITRPVTAPYPAACVSMGDKCKCYTTQGTSLETGKDLCLQIVSGGFYVAWAQQSVVQDRGKQIRPEPQLELQPQPVSVAGNLGGTRVALAAPTSLVAEPGTGSPSGRKGAALPRAQ